MFTLLLALLSSPVVAGPPDQYPGNLTAQTQYLPPGTTTSTDGKYAFSVDCYKLTPIGGVDLADVLATPGYYTFAGGLASGVTFNPTPKHGNMYYQNSLMVPPLSTAYPGGYTPVASDTPAFRTTFTWLSPRYTGRQDFYDQGIPSTYNVAWNVFIVVTGNFYYDGQDWWFVPDDTLSGITGENALPNPYVDDEYNFTATVTYP